MTAPIRWGIASTGKISSSMATALGTIDDAEIVAVGSRSQAQANEFAARFDIPHAHGSYDALWDDDDVDVVYIGSPHSEHRAMTVAALEAGRHVLCEKAFARNAAEADEMIAAAERNDRFLMEAMWSWFMPSWHELKRRIHGGAIGDVVTVDASFCLAIADPNGRHRRADLAGGALLDLGIYPLSIGRFLLGEPADVQRDVRALATLTDEGVDGTLAGVMRHDSGALTTFRTSLDGLSDLAARIVGTAGTITVDAPFWFPTRFTITRSADGDTEVVDVPNRGLAHEAEHVMERIRGGHRQSDIQTWSATRANMALMDEIRRQVGVVYPGE
jgi:predicted dehydrogenase